MVVVSPSGKAAYKQTGTDPNNYLGSYEEENILRTIAQTLGLNYSNLGAAAKAAPMSDFFNSTTASAAATLSTSGTNLAIMPKQTDGTPPSPSE